MTGRRWGMYPRGFYQDGVASLLDGHFELEKHCDVALGDNLWVSRLFCASGREIKGDKSEGLRRLIGGTDKGLERLEV